jgi:plastocyanin
MNTLTTITDGVITSGGSLTIAASISSGGTPVYQWYQRLGAAPNPATDTQAGMGIVLTVPSTLTTGTYYYYCVVSAVGAVSVQSNVAEVNVLVITTDYIIEIITQPEDKNLTAGAISGSLNISAKGFDGELTYQWYQLLGVSPTPETDAKVGTGTSFTIPTALTPGIYYYYCIVSAPDAGSMSRIVKVDVSKSGSEPGDEYILFTYNGETAHSIIPGETLNVMARYEVSENRSQTMIVAIYGKKGVLVKTSLSVFRLVDNTAQPEILFVRDEAGQQIRPNRYWTVEAIEKLIAAHLT